MSPDRLMMNHFVPRVASVRCNLAFGAALGILLTFMTGCASQTFSPDAAPSYLVLRDRSELYRFGPLQSSPPDALLAKNTRVKLLRREFGYSLVQDEQSLSGYVANEDIVPDPDPLVADLPISMREADSALITGTGSGPMLDLIVDDAPLPSSDFAGDLPDDPAD